MQLTTAQLFANPCDEEEDNMALIFCETVEQETLLLSRFPDDEDVALSLGDEAYAWQDLKITFGPERLLIELSASDAADFNGTDHLEIRHATPAGDLAEVEETLRIILDGTGTYISELDN